MQSLQAFILLFGFCSCFIAVNGLICFSCDEAEAPDQCTELRECEPNTVCYLERYVRRLDARMLYRGGCRQRLICDIQKCLQDTIIGKRDDSAGNVCSECCTKDLCNLKLCHFDTTNEDDPTKAVRCYSCDNMDHPENCDLSKICSLTEKCGLEGYYSNLFQKIRFRSDCYRTAECEAAAEQVVKISPVGRRRREAGTANIVLKSECCDHSLCNNYNPFNKTGHDSVGKINSTNVDCAPILNITKSTTTTTTSTTTPTTTTTTPTTTTTTPPTVPTTPKPTTPISCYVCDGPPFLCERSITPQKCSSDQQFCLNKLVNNNDGTRTVLRYCGTENECKAQWFDRTSDRHECTNYDTSHMYTHGFECTYCCTSPLCNHDLVPPKDTLYVDHNQG
ncbi:uncharacterized protein [Argopecten irradians]|uniref:uncharacterized protein n=1 Tax=Argopecten irradians TaxID=31199 RepID=UPI003724B784